VNAPHLRPRRWAAALLGLALLALPARPTWSIVVVDTGTREVCVATATCVNGLNIRNIVPVIVPERGVAAVQAAGDPGGWVRPRIWRGFHAGLTTERILGVCAAFYGHKGRQYGIVNFDDPPQTYSGILNLAAAGGVTGVVGDLRYAIQGNILVGEEVWLEAEKALLGTPGDLSQKVMAAMEVARALGGDGRCSCSQSYPTRCGVPPPGFTKSAHCAYIGIARVGDSEGSCAKGIGCANGDYYLSLNVVGGLSAPDPVLVLQGMYASWRQAQQGRPDQIRSDVVAQADALVADGLSSTRVDVRLVDIEGAPLTSGGMLVELVRLSGGPASTVPGAVIDHGDGTYSFRLRATTTPGQDTWRVRVTDAVGTVVLQPDVTVRVDALAPLHVGLDAVSAATGGVVPFTLNLGAAQAGQPYVLLGSASGTQPGTLLAGLNVPLNFDRLYHLTLVGAGSPLLAGFQGTLDADGRAEAALVAPPGLLEPFAGGHFDWAVVALGPTPTVAGPVGLEVTQ
jgi:hypothetical protein